MRGVLAPFPCLVVALALAGCMGWSTPVAVVSLSSLHTMAYGASSAVAPVAVAYAEPASVRYDAACGFIRDPSVAVEIEAYRPFFILGEVAAPSQCPYVPSMTVESAVAIAGGFSPRARRDRVTLTDTDQSETARFVVPTATSLSPGDTVFVGERWF